MADLRSQISENIQAPSSKLQALTRLRVAIVCDWLAGTGGAERVVLEMHRIFPEAPIYTSQYDRDPKIWYGDRWFEDADVRTGWLQALPKSIKKFLPVLRAWYFSRLKLDDYDLVISISGAEAKYVKPKGLHISYCHSPTHYYWLRYNEYLERPGFGVLSPLAKIGLKLLVGPMRRWDYKAAQRPDYFIANSKHIKSEIKKYYGRDSEVVYPPVDIERFAPFSQPAAKRHSFVTAGRQTPYKRIDLAVEAATAENVPLVVIGNGPEHRRLKHLAGRNVTFLTRVGDHQIAEYFGSAKAFIYPTNIEDFGITGVEAMAAGTPVVAFKAGGPAEYVTPTAGILFDEQTVDSLRKALAEGEHKSFNHQKIQELASRFSAKNFRQNANQVIKQLIKMGKKETTNG